MYYPDLCYPYLAFRTEEPALMVDSNVTLDYAPATNFLSLRDG